MPIDFLNQNILLVSIAVVSGLGLVWQFVGGARAAQVNPAEATLLINREDAQVVDVREADEFAAGHLPEARHLPLAKLAENVGEIEKFKDKPLVVVCASGVRSARACSELKKLGFARAYSLDGGIDAWRQAGLPIKKGGKR